ncbi:hypothetical protein BT63DRAFT_374429 [Microthyrium microscopicum]|uniref:Zn(2)-C6 fungal-type domain-containing protein n=1 Tax=Microthyrium microscopicum TaxID=703497 RepID=A0A6A6U9L1_9PEZI|nr:hypothetical protein BT63DRAFT_374429 [Microthyrium microscopicum]
MIVESVVAEKPIVKSRTKVKTGCATCRVRKIKCDEKRPFCQKCVKTGRTCDGYESPFRFFTGQTISKVNSGSTKPDVGIQPIWRSVVEITLQDVDNLNRCFSTKTLFDVKLNCDDEARQILQASMTDPPIRHAVLSLRTLRADLEASGDGPASVAQPTPSQQHGLEQYSKALTGLASNLSSPNSDALKSALLCCQVLISIEQVRKNYAAMAQHIIRGLRIMHEYRARPGFEESGRLEPANPAQLPLLDAFVIKLFAAPCKFADAPETGDVAGATMSACPIPSQERSIEFRDLRKLVPNMRTELTRIAYSTLGLLDRVSQVKTEDIANQLVSEKTILLNSLESWFDDLELSQKEIGLPGPELISVCFLRLFQLILRIVLSTALNFSADLYAKLQTENDQLQALADEISDRVRAYQTCSGTSSSPAEQSAVH